MNIFVTGGSGFIGRNLIDRLVEGGHNVIAATRSMDRGLNEKRLNVSWVCINFQEFSLKIEHLPNVDLVIHLAGATLGANEDEIGYLYANEISTVKILEAFAPVVQRFIFASSQVVYGDVKNISVAESLQTQSDGSAYACSKLNSENWMKWFQKRYGGTYIALRFCGFIEGGGLIDYLVDQAISGREIELYSHGGVCRDYLSLRDGVDAIIAAVNYVGDSGYIPINIGSGQVFSACQMAEIICDELKSSSKINLLNTPAPQGDFVFCINKARKMLNFTPRKLDLLIQEYARYKSAQRVKEAR